MGPSLATAFGVLAALEAAYHIRRRGHVLAESASTKARTGHFFHSLHHCNHKHATSQSVDPNANLEKNANSKSPSVIWSWS